MADVVAELIDAKLALFRREVYDALDARFNDEWRDALISTLIERVAALTVATEALAADASSPVAETVDEALGAGEGDEGETEDATEDTTEDAEGGDTSAVEAAVAEVQEEIIEEAVADAIEPRADHPLLRRFG